MYVPAASPLTVWLPLLAELTSPLPPTETDVALLVVHEMVVVPGALAVAGVAVMEPSTFGAGALTVTVALLEIGPPLPCAVRVKV